MPKIDITKTELVWPGKYNEDGTRKEVPQVKLPFQIIETINESRATGDAKKGRQLQSLLAKKLLRSCCVPGAGVFEGEPD